MKKMNIKIVASVCGIALCIAPVVAEEAGKIYINPAFGLHNFGDDRGLDSTPALSLGGEYVVMPKVGVEASYLQSNPDFEVGLKNMTVEQYTLDALYYLEPRGNWKPFLNTGVGHGQFDSDNIDSDETQVNLGLGSRYSVDSKWSMRIQAKLINSLDEEEWDSLIMAGFSYAFGGESKPTPKPAPKPAPRVEEPAKLLDQDNDGVFDENDLCMETPPNIRVSSTGCALDTDDDGIFDYLDRCPNSPVGASIDNKGCALDVDKDGVLDYLDNCPNSTIGVNIDKNGCEITALKTETIKLAINFANNSAVVPQSAMSEISAVASFMLRNSATTVVIEGHTDDRGNPEYNRNLSQNRADAVMQLLINRYSVESKRISAVGYGHKNPIEDNNTAAGRQANRRVVAEITHTGKSKL